MKVFAKMKNKYTTQTCVFDLASRTIMPKKVSLKDFMIGHLSVASFREPVYVSSFDEATGVLILLCKQGMFEALLPLVGSIASFQFSDTPAFSYVLSGVTLHELCYLSVTLGKTK